RIERYTVLRSPFIDKKSREQFEIRTHKRIIDIIEPNARTVEALNRLVVPAGVFVKIKASDRNKAACPSGRPALLDRPNPSLPLAAPGVRGPDHEAAPAPADPAGGDERRMDQAMPLALLGTKVGMTRVFTEDGSSVPVTVIQLGPCVVTQV